MTNPYESPQSRPDDEAQRPPFGSYRARLWPRDPLDVLLGTAVGIPLGVLICGGGAALSWWWIQDPLIGACAALLIGLAISLTGIRRLEIGETGMVVRRVVGGTQTIGWADVESIREAGRWEVLVWGLFHPWRVCSLSLTFRGQYRIELRRGFLLFPPRDSRSFVEAIRSRLPQRSIDD